MTSRNLSHPNSISGENTPWWEKYRRCAAFQ
jgi:hypothetical protein